jgi:hypothetical protein
VSATGASGDGNAVLVKFNADGVAQWARTVSTGGGFARFEGVAADSDGNVYAVGAQSGTSLYTYGAAASVAGTSVGDNVVLVKYTSAGEAQWARTVTAGSSNSWFQGVAIDPGGNVYAAGTQFGTGTTYTYGMGVSATGTSGANAVLVKYGADGATQWARTTSTGSSHTYFRAIEVDRMGYIFAAGDQLGIGMYGPDVSASGTPTSANIVLVKYDSQGTAQWARTASTGSLHSRFEGVAIDDVGNVVAVGYQGSGTYGYGLGVTVAAPHSGHNVLLVKYTP